MATGDSVADKISPCTAGATTLSTAEYPSMITSVTNEIQESSRIGWPFLVAQIGNFLIVVGLFALAARSILIRGKGWEVPVWLILALTIPVIFPIIALIHFRRSKFQSASAASAAPK